MNVGVRPQEFVTEGRVCGHTGEPTIAMTEVLHVRVLRENPLTIRT